ncbi:MAG: MarR family transcriptional regulator, partial [Erythrobacter sp.]
DARTLAALTRLDMRVASAGAQMIVSTSMEALDDVFGAIDQSGAQILVQPSRAERVVAVGRVMSKVSSRHFRGRVREMDEQDRAALLRLSDQVDAIAQELDRISSMDGNEPERLSDFKSTYNADTGAAFSFADHARKTNAKTTPAKSAPVTNAASTKLPDPRFVRQMIAARQARARFFDADLFADPAWDMLLDLTAAHAEGARVSVTSLCIAAGVPATTALRWLNQMVESGIFDRVADENDRRRAFIELNESSANAMARYFAEVETPLAHAA